MKREALLSFLAAEILERRAGSRPFMVAIDGRSGSGKSRLAEDLTAVLTGRGIGVICSSVDGFHHPKEYRYRKGEYSAIGYYEDAYDCGAIVDGLLKALAGDVFPVSCRPIAHDVRTDQRHAGPGTLAFADTVLIFEGLFLFRKELNNYWDLRVLLHIDPSTSLSRATDRDTNVTGSAEVTTRKHTMRYEPAWQIYVDRENPESKANVIVDNRDFLRPRILRPRQLR